MICGNFQFSVLWARELTDLRKTTRLHKLSFQGLESVRRAERHSVLRGHQVVASRPSSEQGPDTTADPMPFSQQFSFTRFCEKEQSTAHLSGACNRSHSRLPLTEWEMGREMGQGCGGIEHILLMSPRCLLKGPTERGSSGQRRLGLPSCPTLGFQNTKAFTATK